MIDKSDYQAGGMKGLRDQLEERNANIRMHAIRVLERSPVPELLPMLLDMRNDENDGIRRVVKGIMDQFGGRWLRLAEASDEVWDRLVCDNDPVIDEIMVSRYGQRRVMGVLEKSGTDCRMTVVMRLFKGRNRDADALKVAAGIVARIGNDWAVSTLRALAADPAPAARGAAVLGLSQLGKVAVRQFKVFDMAVGATGDSDEAVRLCAVEGLRLLGDRRAAKHLMSLAHSASTAVRLASLGALKELGNEAAVEPLVGIVEAEWGRVVVRIAAIRALAAIGDERAVGAMSKVMVRAGSVNPLLIAAVYGLIALRHESAVDRLVKMMSTDCFIYDKTSCFVIRAVRRIPCEKIMNALMIVKRTTKCRKKAKAANRSIAFIQRKMIAVSSSTDGTCRD